ncbi:MAG TPA: D-amino acid dehydrogenase [Burkholderiaceae bacterium]
MRVLVLGAGVIGMSSAWYLAQDGHEVTVVDRQAGPGLETSYANAGEISPSYAAPWASPSVIVKAVGWMLARHGPFRLYPKLDPAQWRWLLAMLRNCSAGAYERNLRRMQRLAVYSRDCFIAMRRDTGWRYDDRQQGTLLFFRDPHGLASVNSDLNVLRSFGVRVDVLDADGCVRVEPGLAPVRAKIAGALHMPDDETGDCHTFCTLLHERLRQMGVRFRFGTTIAALERDGNAVSGVRCGASGNGERLVADAYVLALGSHSPLLARPLGLALPVYPVKGYSLTVPVKDEARAPQSSIVDEDYKVALTRLGSRIRVAGTAEVGGYDSTLRPGRLDTIVHVLSDLFPGGFERREMSFWTGLRPMTPDGTPIVGASPIGKLYVNTGHGTFGWTMSLGSGRLLADLVHGRPPAIDVEGLGVERYARE